MTGRSQYASGIGCALCALLLVALPALAGEGADERVTAMRGSDIVAAPESLEGWDYVSTDQPDRAVLEAAAAGGFAAVVDLRLPGEERGIDEAAVVEELGMRYVSLPIGPPEDVTWENASTLDDVLAGVDGPVLLHCASGNRVGALFALRASARGATPDEALAVGKEAGLTRYETAVRERLEEAAK